MVVDWFGYGTRSDQIKSDSRSPPMHTLGARNVKVQSTEVVLGLGAHQLFYSIHRGEVRRRNGKHDS